jgi:hypothetical protein
MTNSAATMALDLPTSDSLGSAGLARGLPEEKLSVQVGNVDRVHVDDGDVGESG